MGRLKDQKQIRAFAIRKRLRPCVPATWCGRNNSNDSDLCLKSIPVGRLVVIAEHHKSVRTWDPGVDAIYVTSARTTNSYTPRLPQLQRISGVTPAGHMRVHGGHMGGTCGICGAHA